MSNIFDLIGRILISALFIISAYNKVLSIDGTMSWMEGFGVPSYLLIPYLLWLIVAMYLNIYIILKN